jgi:hypothetical protein
MRLIAEEIDGSIYGDVILSPTDIENMQKNKVIEVMNIVKGKRLYIGLRIGEGWCHNETYAFLDVPEGEEPPCR